MKKAVLIIFLFALPAHAGFLNDFVNDLDSNLGLQYYQSQERGYVTFGSYSKRSPNVKVNPISITPPSMTVGCNGIDIMTGGLSFLSKDSLKQLYNNLVNPNNAVYIGMSIGMKMLSNELADTIETAMDYINMINSLQLDSCSVTNSVVQLATDEGYRQNFAQQTNRALDNLRYGRSKDYDSSVAKVNDTSEKKADIDRYSNFSGKEYLTTGGSLLEYLFTKWGSSGSNSDPFSFPTKISVARVRALYGDIYYNQSNEHYGFVVPCDSTFEDLKSTVYTKAAGTAGACAATSDNFVLEVGTEMNYLYRSFAGDSSAALNQQFVQAIQGTNVLALMRSDAGSRDGSYLASNVSYYQTLAVTEITYKYMKIHYDHLIEMLTAFREDALLNANAYGENLASSINKLIESIQLRYNHFTAIYNKEVGESYNFIIQKRELEKETQRGYNKMSKIWG